MGAALDRNVGWWIWGWENKVSPFSLHVFPGKNAVRVGDEMVLEDVK